MRQQSPTAVATLLLLLLACALSCFAHPPPTPTPWPEQFHAVLYMNLTGFNQLQITNLWYDWPAGRNVNIVQKQLGPLIHDVEWGNGTSYYYTRRPDVPGCRTELFGVGIPRPGFMDGAEYLGRWHTDGFLCDVWVKVDFITYYEGVGSGRPVRWDFTDGGIATHVMTFEEGVLDESQWQAPSYCFSKDEGSRADTDVHQLHNLRRLSF